MLRRPVPPSAIPSAATTAITAADREALGTLRAIVPPHPELFSAEELARLQFTRWLYRTGRLSEGPEPAAAAPSPVGIVRPNREAAARQVPASGRRLSWRDVCSFLAQVGLVAGVDLADELLHSLHGQNDVPLALANASQLVRLETALGLWVEPALQRAVLAPTHLLGLTLGAAQAVPLFDALYGLGHVGVTFAFALWVYLCRRPLFAYLRTVFLLATALTVAWAQLVPLAPPRLAVGLAYGGRPFRFVDTVFGPGGGVRLGFNEYAAMPSLHVAWALLVGLGLVWLARSPLLRLAGGLYPPVMLLTVVVTGNHYLLDGAGALLVVGLAAVVAVPLERWRAGDGSLAATLRRLQRESSGDDAALRDTPAAAGWARCPAA